MHQNPTNRETPGPARPRHGLIAPGLFAPGLFAPGLFALGLLACAVLLPAGAAASAADPTAELHLASRTDGLGTALPRPTPQPRLGRALPVRHQGGFGPGNRLIQQLLPSRDPADALVDPTSLSGGRTN